MRIPFHALIIGYFLQKNRHSRRRRYLANDYAGAVGEGGQILSESEYAEQREFAELIFKTVIRATGFRRASYWVHGGWLLAILLGIASWFLIGIVFDISGAQRELLEGGTSILVVVILLSVGFWLHKHIEIEQCTRFLKEKVQHAHDGKNLRGLAVISFLAVFRMACPPHQHTTACRSDLQVFVFHYGHSRLHSHGEGNTLPAGRRRHQRALYCSGAEF
jgi:hypothetical protein